MLQIKQNKAGARAEWLVESRYTFGSAGDNNYVVHGKGVHSLQAALEVNGDSITLFNLGGGPSVSVNDSELASHGLLKPGDSFSIGETQFELADPKQNRSAPKAANTAEPAPRWTLKAQNTALANKTYVIEGTKIIGRANDCDICLKVVHLSRKHARLTLQGEQLLIEDLNSSNGTFINGNKVETAIAKAGDEIAFDSLRFTLLGPNTGLDSTHIRQSQDSDATSVRPALNAQQLSEHARKVKAHQQKPHSAAHSSRTSEPNSPPPAKAEASPSSSGTLAFFGTALVIALLLATYYFVA